MARHTLSFNDAQLELLSNCLEYCVARRHITIDQMAPYNEQQAETTDRIIAETRHVIATFESTGGR